MRSGQPLGWGRLAALLALPFATTIPTDRAPRIASQADSVALLLRDALMQPGTASVMPAELLSVAEVRRHYGENAFRPVWTSDRTSRSRAQAAAGLIGASSADGLPPARYHAERIGTLLGGIDDDAAPALFPAARSAELELLLTDGMLTLMHDLCGGRIEPSSLHAGWTLPVPRIDAVGVLMKANTASALRAAMAAPCRQDARYAALRRALADYRAFERAGGWPALDAGPSLRDGDRGARVLDLRRRLAAERFLDGSREEVFDAELDSAVRRYQRLRGLEPDGVVGRLTRAALNVSASDRVRQIEVNLERLRWLPADAGGRRFEVAIAGARAELSEEGRTVLAGRVIIGEPDRPTPVLTSTITTVVLSPYWNVPPRIASEELLPAIRRDPSYLERNHFEVLSGWGDAAHRIDPRSVNWRAVTAGTLSYRFRQRPGPWNPLGAVKFVFPNRYTVFLHGTSAPALFEHAARALSHGCIRFEESLRLAELLLGDQPDWPRELIDEQIRAGVEREIPLASPVPIWIVYRTAWVEGDGSVHFRDDIYGHDKALTTLLDLRGERFLSRPAPLPDQRVRVLQH